MVLMCGGRGGMPLVFQSRAMLNVLEQARRFARTNATVLICGESGVGNPLINPFAESFPVSSFTSGGAGTARPDGGSCPAGGSCAAGGSGTGTAGGPTTAGGSGWC